MPYDPFYTQPSVRDLTVRHAYLLMKVYGPKTVVYSQQAWLRDPEDLQAIQELMALYMIVVRDGVFFRTYQGQKYLDNLY